MQSIKKIYFIEADPHTTKVNLSALEKYAHFYSQHQSIHRTFPPFRNVLTSFPFDSRTLALALSPTHLLSLSAGLIFLPTHSCKYFTTDTLCFWLLLQSLSMDDVPCHCIHRDFVSFLTLLFYPAVFYLYHRLFSQPPVEDQ